MAQHARGLAQHANLGAVAGVADPGSLRACQAQELRGQRPRLPREVGPIRFSVLTNHVRKPFLFFHPQSAYFVRVFTNRLQQ